MWTGGGRDMCGKDVPGFNGSVVVSHCLVGAEEGGHNASVITFWANKTYGVLLQLNQEVCLNRGFYGDDGGRWWTVVDL